MDAGTSNNSALMHTYLGVNSIVFSGTYAWVSIDRIELPLRKVEKNGKAFFQA